MLDEALPTAIPWLVDMVGAEVPPPPLECVGALLLQLLRLLVCKRDKVALLHSLGGVTGVILQYRFANLLACVYYKKHTAYVNTIKLHSLRSARRRRRVRENHDMQLFQTFHQFLHTCASSCSQSGNIFDVKLFQTLTLYYKCKNLHVKHLKGNRLTHLQLPLQ